MYFSDQIALVSPGNATRVIWADVKSVKRSEFYAGLTSGVNLSSSFKVYSEEYKGEPAVEFCGRLFMVERVYSEHIWSELNCSELNQKCKVRKRMLGGDGLSQTEYSEWSDEIQCAVLVMGSMPPKIENIIAGVLKADIDVKVTVLYDSKINPYDQLCIGNKRFDISFVKNVGLRGIWLELYCKEVNANES